MARKRHDRHVLRSATEPISQPGGGVSEEEAEKTRAMLEDYLQWKEQGARELQAKLARLVQLLDRSRQH